MPHCYFEDCERAGAGEDSFVLLPTSHKSSIVLCRHHAQDWRNSEHRRVSKYVRARYGGGDSFARLMFDRWSKGESALGEPGLGDFLDHG